MASEPPDENHRRSIGSSLPPGQGGGGVARPQAQGLDRGGTAARARRAARRASASKPRQADERRTRGGRLANSGPRLESRASRGPRAPDDEVNSTRRPDDHLLRENVLTKTRWIAGSSPAMTTLT